MTSSMKMLALATLLLLPASLHAQAPSPLEAASEQLLNDKALDALVAPIALYPDTLLAQVLMASTYPLEVVSADRWAKGNQELQGDRLKSALQKQSWDDSVKSLVATPSVLSMMSNKLDWTQKLGDAVLAQQSDVMDAVQRLRSLAHAKDQLKTTKEQKVSVKQEGGKQIVAIEPAEAGTVYVPYYNTAVVYGDWPYPDYPPYPYYLEEAYYPGAIIGTGIGFGAAYALWRWGHHIWGGDINWGGGRIDINRGAHVEHWRHNPQHRRGVAYNNANVRQQFAGAGDRRGNKGQMDFRGRDGKQVIKPGKGGAKVGEKRPANRAKAADRGRTKQAGQARQRSQGTRSAQQRPANRSRHAGASQRRAPTRTAGSSRQHFGYGAPSGGHRIAHRSFGGRSFGGGGFGGRSFGGRGGFGGGGFRGGGGRRSDVALKHNIVLVGHLANGLGLYRFEYRDSPRMYVGVLAQEVQRVMPEAVVRGQDGYLKVYYERLGLKFRTYREWVASGPRIPARQSQETE